MIYPVEVQNTEISAVPHKSIDICLTMEEYAAAKLDSTALIQAIMEALEALEASDGS
tara:strand:- start:1260 stop:1430 length:171 start_codon:yes stop_codon:yes gene_type:complete